jgi:hypothetical protein
MPGGHPVHVAGSDALCAPQTVTMQDLTLEEIGQGGKTDMGMRPHIQSTADYELARSHPIEEDERAGHLPLAGWQRPAHLKPSNVVGAGYDDGLDGRGPLRECALITFQGYLPTRYLCPRSFTRLPATSYYAACTASGSITAGSRCKEWSYRTIGVASCKKYRASVCFSDL